MIVKNFSNLINKIKIYHHRYFSSDLKGNIYSKGCGVFGALGNGNLNDTKTFSLINDIKEIEFNRVSSGWGHSAAVSITGDLYIFGRPYDFSNLLKINNIYKFSSYMARLIANSSNSIYFNNNDHNDSNDTTFGENRLSVYTTPILVNQLKDIKSVVCSAGLTIALSHSGIINFIITILVIVVYHLLSFIVYIILMLPLSFILLYLFYNSSND